MRVRHAHGADRMSESDKPPSRNGHADERERAEASLLRVLANWLRRGFGRNGETSWRDSVEELIEEEEEIAEQISDHERDLLRNLLRFGELTVEDAMVPRSDIMALPENATLDEVVAAIKAEGHSRMPVYRGNLDDVAGMVHVRDVLGYWGDDRAFSLADIMRDILFVPESMPVADLLSEMRQTRLHMAVIVDEYGGTHGLVTIEDLVEEIVGEIEDEHDEIEPPAIITLDDGSIEADARVRVDELERLLDATLLDDEDEEDVDTLGGLVFTLAEKVPRQGERIAHPAGFEFEVLAADPRRIERLRIHRVPSASADGEP